MTVALNVHRPAVVALGQTSDPVASDRGTESLGPVRRLDADRIANRDVSLLLALALAESTRELARMRRTTARAFLEGQVALLTGMIRLEPSVAAFLEDTRFLETMAMSAVSLASAGAGAKKPLKSKLPKKAQAKIDAATRPFDLSRHLKTLAAKPAVAKRLGRFHAVRDELIRRNPRARHLFERLASQVAPNQRLDVRDWTIEGAPLRGQATSEQMARDVFGDAPTKRQIQLVEEAASILARGGDPIYGTAGRVTKLMMRDELATKLETRRPFWARESDAADTARIVEAIRTRKVDLSLPLKDVDGTPKKVDHAKAKDLLGNAASHLEKTWQDGWSKEEAEMPEGLHGVTEGERAILDAWYAELMSAQLDLIRWSGRFGDLFADVADIGMGISDE